MYIGTKPGLYTGECKGISPYGYGKWKANADDSVYVGYWDKVPAGFGIGKHPAGRIEVGEYKYGVVSGKATVYLYVELLFHLLEDLFDTICIRENDKVFNIV